MGCIGVKKDSYESEEKMNYCCIKTIAWPNVLIYVVTCYVLTDGSQLL